MKVPRTRRVLLFATAGFAAAVMLAAFVNQHNSGLALATQEANKQVRQEKDERGNIPVAVAAASLPRDPAERALRLARSSRYDGRGSVTFDEASPNTTGRSSISEWYLYLPALPTADSDAVVSGRIVDAKGYLSSDRTGAYSEFTVLIDRVLKDGRGSLQPGGSVIAEREGAIVNLPDGRLIRYEIAYQGMPQVGRRYVLFLKYNAPGDDYQILTGYELRDGRVSPVDEADHFAAYNDSTEERFLSVVREAVLHPPQAPREKQRLIR